MSEELIPGVMKNIDAKTVVNPQRPGCMPSWPGHQASTLAQNDAVSHLFGFVRAKRFVLIAQAAAHLSPF